jgi:dTDP-4-amino-4,6-dideoxygalactose transaminase
MTTGEGGMITTHDGSLAEQTKVLALHGMSNDAWRRFSDEGYRHYQVVHAGYKYNMMDIQAAIGIEQLKRVESNWRKREKIWLQYSSCFRDLPCELPADIEENSRHAYHLFTLLLDLDRLKVSRDHVLCALTAENIGVGVHYNPVHFHPYYRDRYNWKAGDYPNAEYIGERTVSLPLSAALADQDVVDVCNSVRRILKYYEK